jgi:Na+-driven multidrug efflux pump
MNYKNYFLPSLLGGFVAGVLFFVPGIRNLGCCFLLPAAGFFAIYLFKRSSNTNYIEFRDAVITGLLTGLIAAVFSTIFETLLTYLARTNDFVETLPQAEESLRDIGLGTLFDYTFDLMRAMAQEIRETGFSMMYTGFLFISNIIVNPIFSFLGAILARAFFNRQAEKL